MNNEERYEISKKFLDEIKPLKDIWVEYYIDKYDADKSCYKKTMIYQNTKTNEIVFECPTTNEDDKGYVIRTASKYIDLSELRYIEKANVFALCSYRLTVFDEKDKPLPSVHFSAAYLVFPDKTTKIYKSKFAPSIFNRSSITQLSKWKTKFHLLNNSEKAWHETIQKVFPFGLLGGNNYCIINSLVILDTWLRYKEPVKKDTKMQNVIDKLLEIPLLNIKASELIYSKEREFFEEDDFLENDGTNVNVYISPVKEDMICLRWFRLNNSSKEFFETSRLYVDKKNKYFCRKNSFGQFIEQTGKLYPNNFAAKKVIFENAKIIEGTKFEYYKNILPELPKEEMSKILWAFIYHPLTETFWKQGLKECVIDFITHWRDCHCFEDFLIERYGNVDISKKSVNKILGINNFQISLLGKLEKNNNYHSRFILKNIKEALGVFDISSLTNEQSEPLLMLNSSKFGAEAFSLLCRTYSSKTALSMIDKVNFLSDKLIEIQCYTPWNDSYHIATQQAMLLYRDYLSMVNQLGEASNLRPNFETLEDVKNMHDTLLEIFNANEDEILGKAFIRRIPVWKKFEYEGKEFSVTIPENVTDIAKEGIELHHCVKSYIPRITSGETNVVFIRKNEEIDKPFFTVEITNDNTIQQVHGFGNRNASSEEGMTEFVKEWAKKRKLNISNFNKIR